MGDWSPDPTDYGENGDLVVALCERAERLTVKEAKALARVWVPLEESEERIVALEKWNELDKEIENLSDEAWMAGEQAALDTVAIDPLTPRAVADAAMALAVLGLIGPDDFEILYRAWGEVVGEPVKRDRDVADWRAARVEA